MGCGVYPLVMVLAASTLPLTKAESYANSIGSHIGKLLSETSLKCTILALGTEKSIIQDIISSTESQDARPIASPTIIISNSMKPNLNIINRDFKCIIGLATIDKIGKLQRWLLPTHHRQIIGVDNNKTTTKITPVVVHSKHHPIIIMKENDKQLEMVVACKGRKNILKHINVFNHAKNQWTLRSNLKSLDIEKKCNSGFHPLQGQHLTISFFAMDPSLYFEEGNRVGGVDVDIINIIASHHKFTYDTIVADSWYKFFPNKTVGGCLGHLLRGQASIILQQLLEFSHRFGEATRTMYFSDITFMEAKPKQIPPYFNIQYCFDMYSWLGTLLSYVLFCLSICTVSWLKRDYTGIGTLSVTEIIQMMFGIIFQEYFLPVKIQNKMSLFAMQRFLWVFTSMLLTMAFLGNLKTSLIVNNYYDRTMTINEIFDKDLSFHTSAGVYDYLNTQDGLNSATNRRLLCQANKEKSIKFPNSLSPYDTISKVIDNHGGIVMYQVVPFEIAKTKNIKQGKEHPFNLIPEIYRALQWTMAFQKFDPRAEYFDTIITAMTDTGLIDHMFKSRMPFLGMKEYVPVEEEALILEHFYALLMVLAGGLSIGVLVMLDEIFKIMFCFRIFKRRVNNWLLNFI